MKNYVMRLLELLTATLLFLSSVAAFLVTAPFQLIISLLFWVLTGEFAWDINKSETVRKLYDK